MQYPETTHPPPARGAAPPYRPARPSGNRPWPFPAGATVLGLSDVMIQARRVIAVSTRIYLNNSGH